MNSKVTIVMYHYVRDLEHSRYPEIKGLDINLFKGQVSYLQKYYNFITIEALIEAVEHNKQLPEKSVLLTFDDAYIDHFINVFPILFDNNIQGVFFPPVKAITEHIVLDVNKIHFILAAEKNKQMIIREIFSELDTYREEYNLYSNEYYYDKLAHPNRFDSGEVIFIKRLLQIELNRQLRYIITNKLFNKFVGIDEETFSRELYMTVDQLKCMKKSGMHIGSHGFDHYWLDSLTKNEQKEEIKKSIEFLINLGCAPDMLTICYPYGSYNNDTINILKEEGVRCAFTTAVNIADLTKDNKFKLPRLDTNDIPKNYDTKPNKWYFNG